MATDKQIGEYVDKKLLYEHTNRMRLITTATVEAWRKWKIRTLKEKVNAAMNDSSFKTDEETEDAISYLKGTHGH